MSSTYIKNHYLIRCETLNKYLVKSCHCLPQIKRVKLFFYIRSGDDFNSAGFKYNLYCFIYFLYNLFGIVPLLNKNNNSLINLSKESYSLKLVFTETDTIYYSLFSFFVQSCVFSTKDAIFLKNSVIFNFLDNKLGILPFDSDVVSRVSIEFFIPNLHLFENKGLALKNLHPFKNIV